MIKQHKSQKGFSLIEVVISIGVAGLVLAAITGYFQWSFGVFGMTDRKATAESLARSQMESVKEEPYNVDGEYTLISFVSPFTLDLPTAEDLGNGMQKITVTVTYPGFNNPGVTESLTLEGYKLNR
jgi:prepilin-type N-terminal cleavage/methylation domain-containing protein